MGLESQAWETRCQQAGPGPATPPPPPRSQMYDCGVPTAPVDSTHNRGFLSVRKLHYTRSPPPGLPSDAGLSCCISWDWYHPHEHVPGRRYGAGVTGLTPSLPGGRAACYAHTLTLSPSIPSTSQTQPGEPRYTGTVRNPRQACTWHTVLYLRTLWAAWCKLWVGTEIKNWKCRKEKILTRVHFDQTVYLR